MDYIEYLVEKLNLSQRKALSRLRAKNAKRNAKRLAISRKKADRKRDKVDSLNDQRKRAEKQATIALKKKLSTRFNKNKDWSQAPDSLLQRFKKIKAGPKFQRSVKKNLRSIKQDRREKQQGLRMAKEPILHTLSEYGIDQQEIRSIKKLGTKKINILFKSNHSKKRNITKDFFDDLQIKLDPIGLKLDTVKSNINNDNYISLVFKG